jgi:hypothetical protein
LPVITLDFRRDRTDAITYLQPKLPPRKGIAEPLQDRQPARKQWLLLTRPHLTNPETMIPSVSLLEYQNTHVTGLLDIYAYLSPCPEFFLFYLNPKQKCA